MVPSNRVDLDDNRLEVATQFGATAVINSTDGKAAEKITRLVDAVTTPLLLRMVAAGKLEPKKLITHHFRLEDVLTASETFGNTGRDVP